MQSLIIRTVRSSGKDGGGAVGSGSSVITLVKHERDQTVTLSGDIDFAASLDIDPLLTKAVTECEDELLFDLENVTFIDSEGIKMLLHTFGQVAEKNKKARIVRCSSRVRRVFRLAGVDSLLNVAPSLPDPHVRKTPRQRINPLYWCK
jgi:anti-anti-sigma factor